MSLATMIKLRFAERLEELRLAAGKPSYTELERRHASLRRSTIGDALTGRSAPSLDLTLAYVRACRAIAEGSRLPTGGPLFDVDAWRERWLELQRALRPCRRQQQPAAVREPAPRPEPEPAPESAPRPRPVPVPGPGAPGPREPEPAEAQASLCETPWVVQQRRLRPGRHGIAAGRTELEATLDDALRIGAPAVWVTGPPGTGKTALAVRWAHGARDRFPGGLAFADLGTHAATGGPLPVERTLAMLIAELGGGSRPDGPTCREFLTRLYRDVTAGRRVLVILDDASPDLEIDRLIPAGQGSITIVTSRYPPVSAGDTVFVLPIGA